MSLTALLALSAPLIAAFYEEPRVTPVICVLAFDFPIGAFDVIPTYYCNGRNGVPQSFADGFVRGGHREHYDTRYGFWRCWVWALVAGSVVEQIWKAVVINCLAPFLRWPKFSLKGMRWLLTSVRPSHRLREYSQRFSLKATLSSAPRCWAMKSSVFIRSQWISPRCRIRRLRVSSIKWRFLLFQTHQHDVRKVSENVLLGMRILSFFAFPGLWGVSSIAPEIVDVILGPKWTLAVVPLQVLSLIAPLRIVGRFMGIAVQEWAAPISCCITLSGSHSRPPSIVCRRIFGKGLLGLSLAWLVVAPVILVPYIMRSAPVIDLSFRQVLAVYHAPSCRGVRDVLRGYRSAARACGWTRGSSSHVHTRRGRRPGVLHCIVWPKPQRYA